MACANGNGSPAALGDEVERRLRECTARHEAVVAELDDFLSAVSHDLRAPLRAIQGFTRIVLDEQAGNLDAETAGYLNRVRLSASRMSGMLEGLLHLARTGRMELSRSTVDLGRVAGEVVQLLRRREPSRVVECVIGEALIASGDEALLTILLENLIGNAWKFTRSAEHARIEFTAASRDGQTVYTVRDNGAGFDPSRSRLLFKPFQRLHDPEEFPGIGIGLATARRIVARHGGRVWAEGRVGAGAAFSFTL